MWCDERVTTAQAATDDATSARLALFRGRPRWAIGTLIGILIVAGLLYSWNIGFVGFSPYYAASAVSMARNPLALVTGAMNPSALITLDKLSGAFVPQAIAARVFGVHAWALALPQVFEGLVTVLAAWGIGVRWRGPVIGILAAAGTAFTPMLAAMFGRPMEDGLLTMASVLAVLAAQRAAIGGRGRWMVVAAFWVGVAFQAKMLQAWFMVPAVLLVYLLGASGAWRRRLLVAAGAAVATIAFSVSWITFIQLLPHGIRPYADGTTDGNFFTMVFGYNGIDRAIPGLWPDAVPQLDSTRSFGSNVWLDLQHSPIKMFLPGLTSQIGWLYPAALAGAAIEIVLLVPRLRRRLPTRLIERSPRDRVDIGMLVALSVWIFMTALAFAHGWVPHATYYAPIAVPLALLAAVAGVDSLAWWRERMPRWRWVAPALVVATAAWQVVIAVTGAEAARFAAIPFALVGLAAAAVLAVLGGPAAGHPGRRAALRRTALPAIALLVAIGLAPVAWSSMVIFPGLGGSAADAWAGPRPIGVYGTVKTNTLGVPVATAVAATNATRKPTFRIRPPFEVVHTPRLDPAQRQLVDYTVAHVGKKHLLFATDNVAVATTIIIESRYDVLPMSGFSTMTPFPTLAGLQTYLRDGTIRYVLLDDPGVPHRPNPVMATVRRWVRATCTPVLHGEFRSGQTQTQTLYDCRVADQRGVLGT